MSEQIEDHVIMDMPILVEREKLRKRIQRSLLKILLCDMERLPCTVILELEKDLEELGTCPSV